MQHDGRLFWDGERFGPRRSALVYGDKAEANMVAFGLGARLSHKGTQ
jgi:hypothetical protein